MCGHSEPTARVVYGNNCETPTAGAVYGRRRQSV